MNAREGRIAARAIPPDEGRLSEQPTLREGRTPSVADDEVIEHPHIDESEGLLEVPGNELVGLARLEHSARVDVGVMCPGLFCALPLRNGGGRSAWAPGATT